MWHWLTRNGTQEQADRLSVRLVRPIPGMRREVSERTVAMEMDAAESFQSDLGKTPR